MEVFSFASMCNILVLGDKCMQTLVKVMEAERLSPLFNIPAEMQNRRLEVTIRPVDEEELVEKKLAALQRLSGIAVGNTMTIDEIKEARLERQ
jgi:hypothetical protein